MTPGEWVSIINGGGTPCDKHKGNGPGGFKCPECIERGIAQAVAEATEQQYSSTPKPSDAHDLRFLQVNLPWSPNYSQDFRSNPQSHKDFAHAVLHIVKAAGNLATICEEWDHRRPDASVAARRADERATAQKALADLVICALRAASVCPSGSIDLGQSVVDRIETKNGVELGSSSK